MRTEEVGNCQVGDVVVPHVHSSQCPPALCQRAVYGYSRLTRTSSKRKSLEDPHLVNEIIDKSNRLASPSGRVRRAVSVAEEVMRMDSSTVWVLGYASARPPGSGYIYTGLLTIIYEVCSE